MGVPVLVAHDPGCRYARESDGGHSDAAKRISDTHNMHLLAGEGYRGLTGSNPHIGRIFACRLAGGRSDGVLYDTLDEAVRHQHHDENWCAYLRVTPGGMSVCAAASLLRIHRQVYENGGRMSGTDVPRVMIPRLTGEDAAEQIRALERRRFPIGDMLP